MKIASDRGIRLLLSVAASMAVLLGALAAPAKPPEEGSRRVIVQATSVQAATQAVHAAGGRVERRLEIVNGVAAEVPAGALGALARRPGVRAVTANGPVRVMEEAAKALPTYKHAYPSATGAASLWSQGIDGHGVRVAIIDTGVSPVDDLSGRIVPVPNPVDGKGLVPCANFSGSQTCDDEYGHGTFVAGTIAGNGHLSGGVYKGMAPGAEIVSVKIAGRDGSADVSKVLAAIQWVVSLKDRLRIQVLNLSLGTNSKVSWRIDPLNFAVQRAWLRGITVVVSAGNLGPGPSTISKPADDPLVITVGAVDDRESPGVSDDRLPSFSSRGPVFPGSPDQLSKPDVVAPGGRVISLRVPGSFVEEHAPGGFPHPSYRRGSGTSFASGITSGAVALLLQANPSWRDTPNRVKYALASTATKVAERSENAIGAGLIDVVAARAAGPGLANQLVSGSADGTGSIDGSRGDVTVARPCSEVEKLFAPKCTTVVVDGEDTAQDKTFDSDTYRQTWTEQSWYSSQWVAGLNGSSWYGSSWYGSSWYGSSWYGSSWYGSSDSTFYGVSVAGSSWYGAWS